MSEPGPEASDGPPDARAPWKVALVAFVVLGAAYVGAYALLSAEARRDRANLEAIHGNALLAAPDPGPMPPADDSKAFREWRRASDLHAARTRHEALHGRVRTLFLAMLGAFAAQAALTAWVLIRARASAARASRRGTRARGR